jgi:hypothetical protein
LVTELDRNPFVIVEGICLRDTLARVGRSTDLSIYVKCVTSISGLWHDGFNLEDYERDSTTAQRRPHLDDLEYHARVRPHEHSDLFLVRVE